MKKIVFFLFYLVCYSANSQTVTSADTVIAKLGFRIKSASVAGSRRVDGISNNSTSSTKDSLKLITEEAAKKYTDSKIGSGGKSLNAGYGLTKVNDSTLRGDTNILIKQGGNTFSTSVKLGSKNYKDLEFYTNGESNVVVGADGTFYSPIYNWSFNTDYGFQLGSNAGFDKNGYLRVPNSGYINFSTSDANMGVNGFGIRDSMGRVMWKDSLDKWRTINSIIYKNDTNYFKLNYDNLVTGVNAYTGLNAFDYGKLGIRGTSLGKGVLKYDDGGGVSTDFIYFDNSFNDTVAYKSWVRTLVDGSVPMLTLQDALDNGATLDKDNTVNAAGHSLTFDSCNGFAISSVYSGSSDEAFRIENTGVATFKTYDGAGANYLERLTINTDSIIQFSNSNIFIDRLPITYNKWFLNYDTTTGQIYRDTIAASSSGTVTSVSTTNGLGISSSVANSTTTPNITISIDTANASILSRQRAASTYIDSIRLVNTGVIFTTPAAFVKSATTGVITQTLATQTANKFLASPNGSSGTPTFRSIVNADLPKRIDSTEKTLPSGLITFTGTTAPSGTTNNTYEWSQNGRVVTFRLNLSYSVAASGITTVVIAIPTDMPAPNLIRDYQTSNDVMIPIPCNGGNTRTTINPLSANINRNGGTPAIRMFCASQNIQYLQIAGSYFTNN